MNDDVSLDQVMARRFELDEQVAIIQGQQKAVLEPLLAEKTLCEQYIKAELLRSGAQQWKSAVTGHMTYFTTKDSVTVGDMDRVIQFILEAAPVPDGMDPKVWSDTLTWVQANGMWGLLNKAVNKTAAKEILETTGTLPGVKYESFKDLAWRRGKV